MITVQEIVDLGCTGTVKSCPNWINNYLRNSTSYGGTVDDNSTDLETGKYNLGYWTLNAYSPYTTHSWCVGFGGDVNANCSGAADTYYGARAVVEISKQAFVLI